MATISREALFEAAWQRPLTKVAAEFGVTSTALRKTCDKHDIPTPGRGYWAQVASGKTFPRPKLRPVKNPRLETVRINGGEPLPEKVREILERQAEARAAIAPKSPSLPPVTETTAPAAGVTDLASLAVTRKTWMRAKPGADGFVTVAGRGVVRAKIGEASRERGLQLLAAFVTLAAERGHQLMPGGQAALLSVDGEMIGFSIDERAIKNDHVPTPKELKLKAKQAQWGWMRDPWLKYDYAPAGDLVFRIEGDAYQGVRSRFADRQLVKLEAMLGDIVATFEARAAITKIRREEREERERQWQAELARRRAETDRVAREEKRVKFTEALAERLDEAERARRVLTHLASLEAVGPVAEMRTWLAEYVGCLEETLAAETLSESIVAARIGFESAGGEGD